MTPSARTSSAYRLTRPWPRKAIIAAAALAVLSGCDGGSSGGAGAPSTAVTSSGAGAAASSGASAVTSSGASAAATAGTGAATLPAGEFLGRFSTVDVARKRAVLVVRCPAGSAGTSFVVPLTGATVESESNPAHPESGHVVELGLDQWAPVAGRGEWIVGVPEGGGPVRIASPDIPSDHDVCQG